MARASPESAIDDGLTRCLWRARPDGCRPDAALFARTAKSLDDRASFGLGMNAADALADAAKKVAAFEAETRRLQQKARDNRRARADRFKAPPPPNTSQRGLRLTTKAQRGSGEDVDSLTVVAVESVEPVKPAKRNAKLAAAAQAKEKRDAAKLAKLAAREAATKAKAAEEAAKLQAERGQFLAEGPDPVTKQLGTVAPTKEEMDAKIVARVDAGITKKGKAAEWYVRMKADATFWAKVNERCRSQEGRKKKDARRGVDSQKGQAAAKKARKA